MNVQYINPLLESTVKVLTTMAFVEVKTGKPTVNKEGYYAGDVVGLIDLKGKDINGWLAVAFSEPTILDIMHKMLGDKPKRIDAAVMDCVGEITNMITGAAKRVYSEQGMEIDLAIPRVLKLGDPDFAHDHRGKSIMVPFTTPAGRFNVEFYFQ